MIGVISRFGLDLSGGDYEIFLENEEEFEALKSGTIEGVIIDLNDSKMKQRIYLSKKDNLNRRFTIEHEDEKVIIVMDGYAYSEIIRLGAYGTRPSSYDKIDVYTMKWVEKDNEAAATLRRLKMKLEFMNKMKDKN